MQISGETGRCEGGEAAAVEADRGSAEGNRRRHQTDIRYSSAKAEI